MARNYVTKIVFLLSLPASFAIAQSTLSVEVIRAKPATFDQELMNVRGYVLTDKLGHTRIYASANDASSENLSSAIDLLPRKPRNMLGVYKYVKCATVAGTFRQYSDSFTGSGQLVGGIGVLYISVIHPCEASGIAR